jgi:hypothetical protein
VWVVTAIDRTAYPRFKRVVPARELAEAFTPTVAEVAWAREKMQNDQHLLALVVWLKSYQRLGYCCATCPWPRPGAGRAGIGVDHAMAAGYWAGRSDDRYLLAYARDMAAEAHAELGQTRECRTALDEAREIIDAAAATHLPSYVCDPALNAGFAAECLTKLGIGDEAVTAATRCVDLINPPSH